VISLSEPILGFEEKEALSALIDSGWLTMGDRVSAFEKVFAELHGFQMAVAVNSCTSGLHMSLAALGIGPGDEVLVPSLTFVATVNATLYAGAKPVFVDIEKDRPHISLKDAQAKFTPNTRAVIVMHYGGYLADLAAWHRFVESKGLKLIEDAAHAPGMGTVGHLSDAAVFSFFSNKNMTTAEGGMVLARDKAIIERLRAMRAHGMTSLTLDRHRGHAYSYDVTMLGYNYRLDELRAALGLVQLPRLRKWNARRRTLSGLYRRAFAERLPQVKVAFEEPHETAAHLMPVLLPAGVDRTKVMSKLRKEGIQSSIHYPPVHRFSYYRNRFPDVSLPNTEDFSSRELTLPLHAALKDEDVHRVVSELENAIAAQGWK